jgi:nanoRNase/pAp phosphatase (c-di-AMP/oligoRNAs hydrolase)
MRIPCPMCKGCGEITAPQLKRKIMDEKRLTAKKLREQGYSIREIMRLMNYKSPRTVVVLLEQYR